MMSVNVFRKDVSNGKKKVIWVRAKALSTERYICKAKSAISNGLSYYIREVFTEYKRFCAMRVIGTRSREGKLARDRDKPKEFYYSSTISITRYMTEILEKVGLLLYR